MKKFKLFLLLAFVSGMFSSVPGFAQSKKSSNENFSTTLVINVHGVWKSYPLNGVERINVTPSGNLLRIVTFDIDQDDPILELANPVAFLSASATGDFDGDGDYETIYDDYAVLTRSGHLKLIYHVNGKK